MAIMSKYNLTMADNVDYTLSIVYEDSSGQPIDLSGAQIKMQVRESAGSHKVAWAGDSEESGITLEPASGAIVVEVPVSAIRSMPFFTGVYDMVIVWPSGKTNLLLSGSVRINSGVTK